MGRFGFPDGFPLEKDVLGDWITDRDFYAQRRAEGLFFAELNQASGNYYGDANQKYMAAIGRSSGTSFYSLGTAIGSPWGIGTVNSGYPVAGYDSRGNYFNTQVNNPPKAPIATPLGTEKYSNLVQAGASKTGISPSALGNTTTTTKDGKEETLNPVQNLTGYPIQSDDPNVIASMKKAAGNRSLIQDKEGYSTLNAGGNLTGWPVLYQRTVAGANGVALADEFVMPGFLEPNHLAYDEYGMPHYAPPEPPSPAPIPDAPKAAPLPKPPSPPKSDDQFSKDQLQKDLIKQLNSDRLKRRRNSFTSFLGDSLF